MKKEIKLMIVLLSILAFVLIFSKFKVSGNDFKRLIPPTSQSIHLDGKWQKISAYNMKDNTNKGVSKEYYYFEAEKAFIENSSYEGIEYKLRVVNLKQYLTFEYKIDKEIIADEDRDVDVISILKNNVLISEVIKVDDDTILAINEDCIYKLKNVSQSIDDYPVKNNDLNTTNSVSLKDSNNKPIGLYLGLKKARGVNEDGSVGAEKYRTLWISYATGQVLPIYQRENILYPRLKGFWELVPDSYVKNGIRYEFFDTYPINSKNDAKIKSSESLLDKESLGGEASRYGIEQGSKLVNLLFIGNNYISTEEFNDRYSEESGRFKIIPVDNIYADRGVSIELLNGIDGYEAFKNAADVALNRNEEEAQVKLDTTEISLVRKSGRWILEGRVLRKGDKPIDFDIRTVNTKKLVNFDDLSVKWSIIKAENPLVKDIYTSPNGKLALLVLDDKILVYEVEDGSLKGQPIKIINKDKDESVIMAEWADGDFVKAWKNVFIKNASLIDN
ncbi:hypothetical protein [Clostridium sp. 'White wine YQ']|uniref:hypothetical protein n=1 Tax=Clostridium sp. 'White wine YQ' TaxID=3027474 RepID=UPI002365CBAC|nr:hypothetical protein [Clostridium sp. 'White wine YQ']MDD7792633.1 hypothetical protein [Clostridium sp. 'White wine YQ']